jgi:hypothetical protein
MAEEEREAPSTSTHEGGEETFSNSSYAPSEDILKAYGRWEKPNEAVAQQRFQHRHAHSSYVPGETSLEDLRAFGTAHALYFYFLKVRHRMTSARVCSCTHAVRSRAAKNSRSPGPTGCMHFMQAMALIITLWAVVPAFVVFIIVVVSGSWYTSSADLQKATLGNFGLVSGSRGGREGCGCELTRNFAAHSRTPFLRSAIRSPPTMGPATCPSCCSPFRQAPRRRT